MGERGKPLPIETLPRDELEKIQNKRLRYTLRKAYETTLFWHEKFDSLRIKPEDIKNKEDLQKAYRKGLKLDGKEIVTRYQELLPDYVKNNEIGWIEVQTSGFSGTPKKIRYTIPPTLSNELVSLAYNAGKLFEGDRILLALAFYPYSSGILATYGMKNYVYKVRFEPEWTTETRMPLSTNEIITKIKNFDPTYLTTSPSTAITVANEMLERGLEPSSFNVKRILVGGEPSEKERKEKISKKWSAEVFDAWATSEASIFGYECNKHSGMHIAESRIMFSIVNPETLEVLEEKEEGRPLITMLYDEGELAGTYLINYQGLGDITKILDKRGECECGRRFIMVDYPQRNDEIINIRSVKFNAREPERVYGVKDYFNVEIYSRKSGLTRLEVRIVPERGYKHEEVEKEVLDAFLSSNPEAYKLLKGGDITFNFVTPEKLYEGVKVPPGKKRVLGRMIED